MSAVDAAYVAGLLDGEGNIDVTKDFDLRITITNKSRYMVVLCDRWGGSWYQGQRGAYYWYWSLEMCRWYVPQIAPYVRIKADQLGVFWEAQKCCFGSGRPKDKTRLRLLRKRLLSLRL